MPETKQARQLRRYNEKHAALTASVMASPEDDPLRVILSGMGGLSERERSFILAYRRYLAAESAPATMPPELLECGYMPLASAVKHLGTTVVRQLAMDRSRNPYWVPVLKNKTVPVSELARAYRRLEKRRVRGLAQEAAETLNTRVGAGEWRVRADDGRSVPSIGIARGLFWRVSDDSLFGLGDDDDDENDGWHGVPGYSIDEVAAQLGLSKAEVRRLIDDRTIFAYRSSRRGGAVITQAEIDAHKRRLERAKVTADASAERTAARVMASMPVDRLTRTTAPKSARRSQRTAVAA